MVRTSCKGSKKCTNKKSTEFFNDHIKKHRRGQKVTWVKTTNTELAGAKLSIEQALDLA